MTMLQQWQQQDAAHHMHPFNNLTEKAWQALNIAHKQLV
jgi:hypothetical protein